MGNNPAKKLMDQQAEPCAAIGDVAGVAVGDGVDGSGGIVMQLLVVMQMVV